MSSNQQPRIAVVTGSSRGAGKGIALALGSKGYTVYVTGRSSKEGDAPLPGTIYATAEAIDAAGGKGVPVVCDHADEAEVRALFERIKTDHGRLDVLVNNATLVHDDLIVPGPFWEKSLGMAGILAVAFQHQADAGAIEKHQIAEAEQLWQAKRVAIEILRAVDIRDRQGDLPQRGELDHGVPAFKAAAVSEPSDWRCWPSANPPATSSLTPQSTPPMRLRAG